MPRARHAVFAAVVVLTAAVAAFAPQDEAGDHLRAGRDLLAAGKPAEALAVLGRVAGDVARDPVAKEAAVLRVLAALQTKNPTDAATRATELLAAWPADEPWRGRVEGLLAKAAEADGDVRRAAERERALAERLQSDPEKARLAAVYFAWGEKLGAGEPSPDAVKPAVPPNPAAAAAAYRRGADVLGPRVDRAPYLLAVARYSLAAADAGAAIAATEEALKAWKAPGPNEPGKKPDVAPPWVAEAHLRRGEALLLRGDVPNGRAALRAVLALPSVEETPFAAPAWRALGASFVGDPASGALEQARAAFASALRLRPDGPDAAAIRRASAAACLAVGAFEPALAALADVVGAAGVPVEDAAWARFKRAEAFRALRRFDDARAALHEFLARHPAHPDVPAAQQLLPTLALEKAKAAFEEKRREDGLAALRAFVEEHPLDPRAPQASLDVGAELLKAREFDRARDAYRDARERWRAARPDAAAAAGLAAGVVEEEHRRDLEAAAKAYQEVIEAFGAQPAAADARARFARLSAVEISLASPRIFGAHEAAEVELALRNVKETTLRIYRLDAAGYFERKGTLAGAESLDVALVKADRTVLHPTPSFARYRADRLKVPLALDGRPLGEGAYLVSAEAERRRAVVLVVVSKIRLVVKHAPTEVFAWAVDAATGAPAADVEVLVRGAGLKTSAKTGADGSARVAIKPEHGACSVLARLGASAAPGLAAAPAARGAETLAPRAHWTFDRPIYRPGDEVRYAVVVRDVDQGAFTTPEGEPVDVAWIDPRGRTFSVTSSQAGAFGRLDGAVRLPSDGATGDWTLRATLRPRTDRARTFDQTVGVREYRKPEFKVAVRTDRPVLRPGARAEFRLGVEPYFGGSAGRVDYRWRAYRRTATFDAARYRDVAWFYKATEKTAEARPDASWEFVAEGVGATDEAGAAAFGFDTLHLVEPQQYLVQASVLDASMSWSTGSGTAYASWTPGNVVVLPDRRAYRAGDRVTARVVAVDWSGAPLPLRGTAEVLLVREEGGRRVEEPAGSAAVDLGLAGEAEVKIDAPRAGRAIVRFTGSDAAGLKVVGEAGAEVTGERPDLSKEAKIVFEREVYRAGEKARLFVDVPRAPAIGLLTFEGETVLLHRVVTLAERASVVEIELPELLAPNVVATLSLPSPDGLLTSEDPLVVLRHLDVAVAASTDVARPGEKIKFSVTVKDQAGRPAAAAVTLAMSDSALHGLGGVGVQDPRFTFNRDVRPHLVRTGSSFAFRQEVAARALDADLVALDEQLRRKETSLVLEERARKADGEVAKSLNDARRGSDGKYGGPPAGGAPALKPPGRPAGGGGGGVGGKPGGAPRSKAPAKGGADKSRDALVAQAPGSDAGGLSDSLEAELEESDHNESFDDAEDANGAPGDAPAPNAAFARRSLLRAAAGEAAAHGAIEKLSAGLSWSGEPGAAAVPPPIDVRENLADVAAWAPTLVADGSGRAEIEVTLPDNLTVWTAEAAAVDRGVAGGLGSAAIRVRKDVLVRVALPPYLATGDESSAVVIGRRLGEGASRLKLSLRSEGGAAATLSGATEGEREAPRGEATLAVALRATGAGAATFTGEAATDGGGDGVKAGLSVLPFGEPWRVAERRTLKDRVAVTFEVPAGVVPGSLGARVLLRTGLAAELLDGLAFLAGYPHGSLEVVAARVVGAAVVHRALTEAGIPSPVAEADLKRSVERFWTTLRAYQNEDGGFGSWPGRPSEPEATALALESLARLRDAGFVAGGDLWTSAINGATSSLRQGRASRDQRAALAAALVSAGADQASELNALFRERDGLATASLARLLRASVAAGRGALKADLLEALRGRRRAADAELPFAGPPRDPWVGDDQETTALVLLAYQAADARVEEQEALVAALRRRWTTRGCVHVRATASTALALARHVRGTGALAVAGDVVVSLDGKALPPVRLDGGSPRGAVELDPALLSPGRHEIVATRAGGGEVDLRVVAGAVVAAESADSVEGFFEVARRVVPYEDPDRPERTFAEGWSIVDETKRPPYEPPPALAQAVAGTRATVRLTLKARDDARYVVLEDPTPAGFDVVEAGVRGPFARYERRFGRTTFFFERLKKGQTVTVTYPVYATLPGRYRAMPAEASEMHAPEMRGRSASLRFEVVDDVARLARVEPPKPTPDKRLAAARDAFAREDYAAVLDLVGSLATELPLTDEAHDETLLLVERAALRAGRPAEAVRARDAFALRNPNHPPLGVDDVLRLGGAYLAVGDAERAREQYQSAADDAFGFEMRVAEFLESLGLRSEAVARRAEAVLRHPHRGPIPDWELALAGSYLELPDPAITQESARPLQRMRWAEAAAQYQRVMAWAPGSDLAARAALERVRLFALLGLPARVRTEARAFAARFPTAPALDEVLFAEAEASFALKEYGEVKAPATAVRTTLFRAYPGEPTPTRRSAYVESAAYLLGKVAHVEGRLDEAVRLYGEAAARVPEAAESHRFFVEKELAVDAVVRVHPNAEARLPLRVKNVEKATVQLYPVDLGVLFATRKSFAELNRADLAGITPALSYELATGAKPYASATAFAPLARTKDAASAPAAPATGAYLAVVTDGERAASAVVLVSDLELTVQAAGDGVLRCYLSDAKGLPVAKARVTTGQGGSVWYAGETDERGMLMIPLRGAGKATVVAESGDRYAAVER